MKHLKLGLISGRHEMPADIEGFVYETVQDPTDVKALTDFASERLIKLFPDVEVGLTYLPNQADYTDIVICKRGHLDLYVTGLTVALVAVLNACRCLGIQVTLYHYNRDTGTYFSQPVL